MMRECTKCQLHFTAADLAREESKNMEAERKSAGLIGVRFVYYHCPGCGTNDIFVDILPRDGEAQDDFIKRRSEMDSVVRKLHAAGTEAVVVPVAKKIKPFPADTQ
jgi:hypothetical protein